MVYSNIPRNNFLQLYILLNYTFSGYQQHLADKIGQPDLGIVSYAANRTKDDLPEDVVEFFNFAYSDREKEADNVSNSKRLSIDKQYQKESNSSFKHISKFRL